MFGLQQKHIDAINACFAQYPQIEQVILYGSRAKGNYKNGSDIDLTIVGDLDYNSLLKLENQLDDLLLPYKMDLSLKHKITNPDLLNHIERVGKVFYEKAIEKVLSKPDAAYGKAREWKTYKLADFVEINPRVPLKQGNEYSFVEMKDLDATQKYASPSARRELKGGSKFQNGDTLFARITPCLENGKICQVKNLENNIGFGSTEFLIFRGKENVSDNDFVYYLSRSEFVKNNAIQMMTGTSGRQRVEKSALEQLEIQIPNIETQKEIAQILSSLDDKIALNLQMNQTLEAMAQAIFKEWFVNLNFPKSLNLDSFDLPDLHDLKNQDNQENPKNHSSDNGLPKGWSVEKLTTICTVKYGKDHKHLEDGDIPVYGSGGIMRYADRALYENESILIPRKGTLSNLFYVTEPFWSVDTMFYTIINENSIRKYLFYLLKSLNLASMNVGSAVPSLTTEVLNKIDIVVPNSELLQEFEDVVSTFYQKMDENNRQIKSLTQLRDTLLPKLMSGQIKL